MFSIVIPCLNEGYYLDMTLDSIYNNVDLDLIKDIIIVDDFSDRDEYSFLDKHFLKKKIKFIKNKKREGPSYSRNIGAKNSKGDILIFLDAHMYCYNLDLKKIYELKEYISKGAIQGTIGNLENKYVKGQIYKIRDFSLDSTWDIQKDDGDIVETPAIAGGLTIISRNLFNTIGGFNNFFNSWGAEDIELSLKLWSLGYNMYYTDLIGVAHYFKSKHNYNLKTEDVLYNRLIIYKMYFEGIYDKDREIYNFLEEKYSEELLISIKNKINSNIDLLKYIHDFKFKINKDINSYFSYFKKYYEF